MNFIENESKEKLRGGYYTPDAIARFLVRWIHSSGAHTVLEPSCGDGAFLEALSQEAPLAKLDVTAIELSQEEAEKARGRIRSRKGLKACVLNEDFLDWSLKAIAHDKKFDAVVGNPPFIRYQYLPRHYQEKAEAIFHAFHLPFTKHTNAWVPFVVASIGLLRPGGLLGMVLPAEIIHVMHAQTLRTYLGHACARLLVVDPEDLWFEGTLQGAVLLLAEKKGDHRLPGHGLAIRRVSGPAFLSQDARSIVASSTFANGKTVEGKWTRALLPERVRTLFDDLSQNTQVRKFIDAADVDVGLVTGANKFFLVPSNVVAKYGLEKWSHPMFGRSEHCPGVIYDRRQHAENDRNGLPTNFLWFKRDKELTQQVRAYLALGERDGIHKRFKCRVRDPWYQVPSVYSTEVGMLKRSHDAPRLIRNVLGAYTTDTAYRIRTKTVPADKFVYCFMNSVTALSAELEGRHYGGGVLELVPSEIERLLIPLPKRVTVSLARLDSLVRQSPMSEVLVTQDVGLLSAIGVAAHERDRIHQAWCELRDRRHRVSRNVSDDFESESERRSCAPVNTNSRVEQVAPSY